MMIRCGEVAPIETIYRVVKKQSISQTGDMETTFVAQSKLDMVDCLWESFATFSTEEEAIKMCEIKMNDCVVVWESSPKGKTATAPSRPKTITRSW